MLMKRLVNGLLKMMTLVVIVIACCLQSPSYVLAASPSDFVMVSNDSFVNLRSGPGESFEIIGSYTNGVWLTVEGQTGDWYYIKGPDGKTGYISAAFTVRGTLSPVPVGVVSNPNASSFLNFRLAPSYDAAVLDHFYNGVPATVISQENGWCYADVNGTKGYLRAEFLKFQTMLASQSVSTVTTPNNTSINLRQGPGTQYTVTRQFPGNTYVMILLRGTGWSKVSVNGYVGFMDNSFLKAGIHPLLTSGPGTPGGPGGSGDSGNASADGYGIVSNPVSTQVLNLRESPATSAKVLGRYVNGTRVTILAQGEEWCRVRVDKTGATGYMMTRYLKLYNLPSVPTATVKHPQFSFVNLRKSASMNAGILKRITHGQTVTVLIPGKDWYKVRHSGSIGYMVEYFLAPK